MRVVAEDIVKRFDGRRGEPPVEALGGVTITVEDREFVCLLGPSGCGKSTLLQILAGLEVPTEGRAYFDGVQDGRHPSTALVFQQFALFPWMSVSENVEFPLRLAGVPAAQREAKAAQFLEVMRLEGFEGKYPRELSGGMQQRVAIARALMTDPDLMLMDEPFGSLDAQTRVLLQEELLKVWESTRNKVLFVTHSIEEALLLADRIYIFTARPGRIREVLTVPLPRPRQQEIRTDRAFGELYQHIWGLLRDEAELSVNLA